MADAVQIRLTLENEKLTKQLKDTERKFSRLEQSAKKSTAGMSKAFAGIGVGLAAATAAIGTAVTGLVKLGNVVIDVSKSVADLNDQAQQLGISFKAFQELKLAAIQSGVDVDKLTASLGKMQVSLGKMAETGKDGALRRIGLDIQSIINLTPEQQFAKIADGLNGIDNASQRAAAGAAIFGKGFRDISVLVAEGSTGLKDYADQAQNMGIIISDVTRNDMAKFDDSVELLKLSFQAALANGLGPLVKYLNNEFTTSFANGGTAVSGLTKTFVAMGAVITGTFEAVKGLRWYDILNPIGAAAKGGASILREYEKAIADIQKQALIASFDWSNFEPKPPPAAIGTDAGTQIGKNMAAAAAKGWESSLEIEKFQLPIDDLANEIDVSKLEDTIGAFDPKPEQKEAWKNLALAVGDTAATMVEGAQSAQEAFKDLAKAILAAIIKAAILAAFKQGSFVSNLSGIFGGTQSYSGGGGSGGPSVRVYNYGAAPGGVQATANSDGSVDIVINKIAGAIARGGNPLDQALRRSYGLGRVGI